VSTLQACLGAGQDVTADVVIGNGLMEHHGHRSPWLTRSPNTTVVVARTHAAGLLVAQEIAVRQADRSPTGERFAGLALVADAPGKLPRPLADLSRQVSGAYTDVWRIPWVEAWRLGARPDLRTAPAIVRRVDEELRFAVAQLQTTNY